MKKFLVLIVLVVVAMTTQAQKYYSQPADKELGGTEGTVYYPSATGYDLKNIESGAFSFTFTHTDVTDSLSVAAIQWSNDASTWTSYTGNAALSATTTDGQDKLYIETPLVDRYVRVILTVAAGDSVSLSNMVLMLKEE